MSEKDSPEPADLDDRELRRKAVKAARGEAAFDTLIVNGVVVDMVTLEHREADVGLVGPLIASVHPRRQRRGRRRIRRRLRRFCDAGPHRRAHACRKLDGDARDLCGCGRAARRDDDRLGPARVRQCARACRRRLRHRGDARPGGALCRAGALLRPFRAGARTRGRGFRRRRSRGDAGETRDRRRRRSDEHAGRHQPAIPA